MKKLTKKQSQAIEKEVMMLLHAMRDNMRNEGVDTTKTPYSINNAYYAEAFGIMRCLRILGYGSFEITDKAESLDCWFNKLLKQLLKEENFGGSNKCDYCLEHYNKDSAGRKKY